MSRVDDLYEAHYGPKADIPRRDYGVPTGVVPKVSSPVIPVHPAALVGDAISNALSVQVGGAHYKTLAIQPVEYCHKNKLGPCETAVVKYITRWKEKGGKQDLEKAKHFIDLLMELEGLK